LQQKYFLQRKGKIKKNIAQRTDWGNSDRYKLNNLNQLMLTPDEVLGRQTAPC
jgi:hypothetical protein